MIRPANEPPANDPPANEPPANEPPCVFQYGRSDSYRVATTQDKDEKESPKKKGVKDMDDLKKEVPIVSRRSLLLLPLWSRISLSRVGAAGRLDVTV